MERLFTGKRLHSFNGKDAFFVSSVFNAGIWIKDELDEAFKDLPGDAQKNLTDTTQEKVLRVKNKEDITGGKGIPLIIATNYRLSDIIP